MVLGIGGSAHAAAHGRGCLSGGDDALAQGLGPIDDAGFVKVYESFTGKRIAGVRRGESEGR